MPRKQNLASVGVLGWGKIWGNHAFFSDNKALIWKKNATFHIALYFCISQFQARSSPPRATPGHLTPVRLHIVGHLTRIETRPIGHLTRRKNAGQRSRLKMICSPCNMSQLLVVFDKIYGDICGMSKFPQASFSLCLAFEARLVGMSRFHNIVFFIIVLVITVF